MATPNNGGKRASLAQLDVPVTAGMLVIGALLLLIVINQAGLSVNVGVRVG